MKRASLVLLLGVMSCKLEPERAGTCQPAVALEVGFFERAEAYHDDCAGPDEKGDFFTLSLAAQTNILLTIEPEESFAPKLAIYAGSPGDVNPPLVARLSAYFDETLAIRLFLQPGEYFVVAGTQTRDRALYRITASAASGADCSIWNFVTKGVELAGLVTQQDCPTSSAYLFFETFEMWRQPNDSVTVTVIADSSGFFQFGEACCENTVAFAQVLEAGDSVTFGHRSPSRLRPYRASFRRDIGALGPGAYRLRID